MKKIFAIVSIVALMSISTATLYAQDAAPVAAAAEQAVAVAPEATATADAAEVGGEPMHQVLKQKFMEGGVMWMSPILLCLILGLAIII
ncbi:MAG: MotA/TolQ/ExbB proton channel family protein, partial [Mucinivorans sp.]